MQAGRSPWLDTPAAMRCTWFCWRLAGLPGRRKLPGYGLVGNSSCRVAKDLPIPGEIKSGRYRQCGPAEHLF